jgi:hypothetical protein
MALLTTIDAIHNDYYLIKRATDPLNGSMTMKTAMGYGTIEDIPSGATLSLAEGDFVWHILDTDTPEISYGNEQYRFIKEAAILFTEAIAP